MPRIRKVEIKNFRGVKELRWCPTPGINCLIGPGDSGKSSVLDAIDLCLGPRRSVPFTDADFHDLDVDSPIEVEVTLGELDDDLKNLETYGPYLRSFDGASGIIDDEPCTGKDTVLTVRLTAESDLEPTWSLVSQRAAEQGLTRNLIWGDRVRLAPTRIGALADHHLGWGRSSVLNRVSEQRADASAALARAAREARAAFGEDVQEQVAATLAIVARVANELGIPIGDRVKAMLDAHSVSFGGGTISLHDERGIPLRGLGSGSTRLLIAGLQRNSTTQSKIILVDELEYGLEPHRIIRFLGALGAKETEPPLQVFMSTHSPVVLQELNGNQLFITRPAGATHVVLPVGTGDEPQGTIRKHPAAFLAASILVCEGASEVGFVRGLDQHMTAKGQRSIGAAGTALVDGEGGEPNRPLMRAKAFAALGYRTALLRDADQPPDAQSEAAFIARSGKVFAWRNGRSLEDELFLSVSDGAVDQLIERAVALHGASLVNEHIKSASENEQNLDTIRLEWLLQGIGIDGRRVLGRAARFDRGWFKSTGKMEDVARNIIGPDLANADAGFRTIVEDLFAWANNAGR